MNIQQMHSSIYDVFYSQHFHQHLSVGIPEGNGLIQPVPVAARSKA